MKKVMFLFVLFISFSIFSQNTKVVKVVSEQLYTINGGFKSAFGGKSRIAIPIILPKNTIEWYYVFSANKKQNNINKLTAFTPLTRIVDKTGTIETVLNQSLTGLGDTFCDIYILEDNNINYFINKQGFNYYINGSRENIKKGTVKVGNVGVYENTGNAYFDSYFKNKKLAIGIRNPNRYTGIHVTLEVFAIVKVPKEKSKAEDWDEENRNKIVKYFKNVVTYKNTNIPLDNSKKEILAYCMSDKVFNTYDTNEFVELVKNKYKCSKVFGEICISCVEDILGRELTNEERQQIKYFKL